MKPLRGVKLFFFNISSFGEGCLFALVITGGLAFFEPAREMLKEGLPRFLPPFAFASIPTLAFIAFLGLLGRIAAFPAAAHLCDRIRPAFGRRSSSCS